MLNRINNLFPSYKSFEIPSTKQICKNLVKIALPAIALAGLAYASTAEAGPIVGLMCFISCMSAGTVATGGAFIPASVAACNALCAGLTVAPTP